MYHDSMPHIHELIDYTTSAFIMHPTEPKVLLLKHKKIGKWLQPGGHIELNENPIQALHHELEEETGLKPRDYTIIEPSDSPKPVGKSASNTVLPLPFYINEHFWDGKGPHKHVDICYLAKSHTATLTDDPDGASAIGWFTQEQVVTMHESGDMYQDTRTIIEWLFNKYM
jgi:8-oxo-dGTP pyrophosphatase MutT (NUDIX family)